MKHGRKRILRKRDTSTVVLTIKLLTLAKHQTSNNMTSSAYRTLMFKYTFTEHFAK